MKSTMQAVPLTVTMILQYGTQLHAEQRVITATADGYRETSYAELGRRTAQLAHGLRKLGVTGDDRVATFMWNNGEHLEAYLAAPSMGAVLHTLNIRLFPEQIVYVANQAEDRVVLVDMSLAPILAPVLSELSTVRTVVAVGEGDLDALTASGKEVVRYDELLAGEPTDYDWPDLDENSAAAMCYTSGTTGNPKGVVYSHRSTYLHSMAVVHVERPDRRRRRPRAADRADVPRQRMGPAVRGGDGRCRPADAGPLPARRASGRDDRGPQAHARRRGADDLERRAALPRGEPRSRHVVAATGGVRRVGGADGADEGVRAHATACRSGRPGA